AVLVGASLEMVEVERDVPLGVRDHRFQVCLGDANLLSDDLSAVVEELDVGAFLRDGERFAHEIPGEERLYRLVYRELGGEGHLLRLPVFVEVEQGVLECLVLVWVHRTLRLLESTSSLRLSASMPRMSLTFDGATSMRALYVSALNPPSLMETLIICPKALRMAAASAPWRCVTWSVG